jgi:hypothetical protein
MSRRELYPWCRVPPVVHRIRLRKVFDGQPGQRASIATRFVCTTPGSDLRREFSLERDTTVIFVEVPGSQVEEFPFANEVKAISFESAIAEDTGGTLHPFRPTASAGQGDVLLAGFEDGRCMAVDVRRGETPWHQALDGRVNAAVSLAYGGRGYFFVGTEEGLLACLDTEGSVVWRHEIDYPAQDVAEKLESRWSSHQPAVRALAVGMTPNGPLLVAGFGDHHIYRIDPFSGDVLWELPLARGSASHLLIDDLERDGSPRIVVGLGSPAGDGAATVVSPDGDFLGRLATPFDASPWATSQTTALLAVDLDGDGGSEIIKAAATPIEQVSCWKKGELEWTVDVGEWPAAVACLPGRVLLVGSRSGWVFLIDPAGQIQFRDFLGESVRCAVACDGHFIVGGRSGGLYEIDAGCGQSSLLRRFSSSVERVHSAGPLVALMESGEIFIG